MKFAPKTEKELSEANLWPVGNYAFEVLEAEEAVDKNSNPMFKLKVKVFKDSGASQNIFDYVSPTWMEFKLRHLADACGLLAEYESGEIEAYQLVGKTGYCKVFISKDKKNEYPDSNKIADYLTDKPADKKTLAEATNDDALPF